MININLNNIWSNFVEQISSNWFRVVFERKTDNQVGSKTSPNQKEIIDLMRELGIEWSEKWSELSKRKQQIITLLLEKPQISRSELSDKLGINSSAVQKHLGKLKELKLVKRVGPDKGGHWEVLK